MSFTSEDKSNLQFVINTSVISKCVGDLSMRNFIKEREGFSLLESSHVGSKTSFS